MLVVLNFEAAFLPVNPFVCRVNNNNYYETQYTFYNGSIKNTNYLILLLKKNEHTHPFRNNL